MAIFVSEQDNTRTVFMLYVIYTLVTITFNNLNDAYDHTIL